jgi:uncharacterized protein (DUF952 family)
MSSRPRRTNSARISGPAELLQAVPYLLGFHPTRSLVLVGLHDERLVVTARLDLRDALFGGVPHAVTAMMRGGSTSFVAVIYDDDEDDVDADLEPDDEFGPPTSRCVEVYRAVRVQLRRLEAELRDALVVSDGRWWSLTCGDFDCCPPEGRPLPDAPSPFATAAMVEGVVALPNRAALEEILMPLPDAERASMAPAIEAAERAAVDETLCGNARRWELSVKRGMFRAARAADEPGWAGVSHAMAARFAAALRVTGVRDAVWLAIDGDRLDGRALWRDLGRRSPSPYDAPPLFLYGWAAWRAGDGAAAGIAADRAVASDPDYSAADLLRAAISSGVDPRRMPKLRPPRTTDANAG